MAGDVSGGLEFDLNDVERSSFKFGNGPASFGVSRNDVTIGLKKSFDVFKVERCAIEMVKASVEVGIKTGIVAKTSISADIVVEGVAGALKFTYPVIPRASVRARRGAVLRVESAWHRTETLEPLTLPSTSTTV